MIVRTTPLAIVYDCTTPLAIAYDCVLSPLAIVYDCVLPQPPSIVYDCVHYIYSDTHTHIARTPQ